MTPAISVSQGAGYGLLLMGTSMWSCAVIQFNIYLLHACLWLRNTQGATGEKEIQGRFPPSRGLQYYCLPTKSISQLGETDEKCSGRSEWAFQDLGHWIYSAKRTITMSCFCVCAFWKLSRQPMAAALEWLSHRLLMTFRAVKWSFPEDENQPNTGFRALYSALWESLHTIDWIRWGW